MKYFFECGNNTCIDLMTVSYFWADKNENKIYFCHKDDIESSFIEYENQEECLKWYQNILYECKKFNSDFDATNNVNKVYTRLLGNYGEEMNKLIGDR